MTATTTDRVELLDYDLTAHTGAVAIGDHVYALRRKGDAVEMTHNCPQRGMVTYTVAVKPHYSCNCADARYRSRERGCKHVRALRDVVSPQLRAMRAGQDVWSIHEDARQRSRGCYAAVVERFFVSTGERRLAVLVASVPVTDAQFANEVRTVVASYHDGEPA